MWDDAMGLYAAPPHNARPTQDDHVFRFASGASIGFSHLQHEKTKYRYKGAQIPYMGFDELTSFTETQFFYMLSRNRSSSGIRPCVRATTNADASSWVRGFIDWWLADDGFARSDRAGEIRYYHRHDDENFFGDTPEEVLEQLPYHVREELPISTIQSVTFIPADLYDNEILMRQDPGYLARLMSQERVERERLLRGNWNVTPGGGDYFSRTWMTGHVLTRAPRGCRWVRYWDFAGTPPSESNPDPDYTATARVGFKDSDFYITDVDRIRGRPREVEQFFKKKGELDGPDTEIWYEEEPGASSKLLGFQLTRLLPGYSIRPDRKSKSKQKRAGRYSAAMEQGRVFFVNPRHWGVKPDVYWNELELFDDGDHDDMVDVSSGAVHIHTVTTANAGSYRTLKR